MPYDLLLYDLMPYDLLPYDLLLTFTSIGGALDTTSSCEISPFNL